MTIVVENSTDQVVAAQNGGVFPVPPEVAADNAKRSKEPEAKPETKIEPEKTEAKPEDDDTEGDDGLTVKQRREWTEQMRKTIGKKHRAQKEAEELAASQYAERELAVGRAKELAEENARLKAQLAPKPEIETAPKREDFKDDQAFWEASVDFRVNKKLREEQAVAAKVAEEALAERTRIQIGERMDKAREIVEDFDDTLKDADYFVPDAVKAYMADSDMIAEIGYHFAKNPEVLERLAKITAGVREGTPQFARAITKQLVELGKIESKLTPFAKAKVDDGHEPSEKTPAKASRETAKEPSPETGPAPSKPRTAPIIRPLNGGSAPQVERDEADMTGSQVVTSWERKHGVQLTARKRH